MEIKLSIVVPCYNEAENIELLVEEFAKFMQDDIELILVDNGSTDKTAEVLLELHKKHDWLEIVVIAENIGYGNGIWQGIKQAKGKYIGWMHGDLQTPADSIFVYLRRNEFAKGRRQGRSLIDRFFTFGMSCFVSLILRKWLNDIHAQPNIAHRDFYKDLEPPKDWAFDTYMYYKAKEKGYKIVKFPVEFGARIHGESSWNTSLKNKWKFIKRTIISTWGVRKNVTRKKYN